MPYLIFDIESAALPFESFDDARQEYLLRGFETEEEREQQIANMSLNGLTAQVVCIGMIYAESLESDVKRIVYSNVESDPGDGTLPDGSLWRRMTERELLERWWELFRKSGLHLVSFNGRGFDCPFLMLRSAMLGVRPTRNLMAGTKFNYGAHTDLLDELSYFGFPSKTIAPMKRFNLDFYCKAFGITSPKEEGITGDMVPKLFAEGRHEIIAEYCMRDIDSTWRLLKHWKQYLDVSG